MAIESTLKKVATKRADREYTHGGCSSYEESDTTLKKATVEFANRAMQKNKKKAHQTIRKKYIFDLANFGGNFESTLKKSLQIENTHVVRMGSQAPYSKKLLSVFLIVYMQTHKQKKAYQTFTSEKI